FTIDSYGLLVYGSLLPIKNFFVDGYVGYGRQDYSTDRRTTFNLGGVTANGGTLGHTDGDEFKAGFNTGYDFVIRNFTIGPRVGLNYRETTVDGFTERGATGLELTFSRYSQTSLTTVAGLYSSVAFSTGFGVVVPQIMAEYVHEFEDDQKFHEYRFVQDF